MTRSRREKTTHDEASSDYIDIRDDTEIDHLEVGTKRGPVGWTIYVLFRLPGKVINWLSYMFPQHGDVLSSRRRFGDPRAEVIVSLKFWCGIAFVAFWVAVWTKTI